MFDMVKAVRFCHIYTGIEDSCGTWVKGWNPLRGVGQSPAYQNIILTKLSHLCFSKVEALGRQNLDCPKNLHHAYQRALRSVWCTLRASKTNTCQVRMASVCSACCLDFPVSGWHKQRLVSALILFQRNQAFLLLLLPGLAHARILHSQTPDSKLWDTSAHICKSRPLRRLLVVLFLISFFSSDENNPF